MGRKLHCDYVKEHLGKPLRVALADIIVHQPIDPINYLANYLIKYRHNELKNVVKGIEQQDLLEEREKYMYEQEEVNFTHTHITHYLLMYEFFFL